MFARVLGRLAASEHHRHTSESVHARVCGFCVLVVRSYFHAPARGGDCVIPRPCQACLVYSSNTWIHTTATGTQGRV